jgi:hypothetical protein
VLVDREREPRAVATGDLDGEDLLREASGVDPGDGSLVGAQRPRVRDRKAVSLEDAIWT